MWHSNVWMEAMHCELLCRVFVLSALTSLFCRLPCFRHPCTLLLLTRLRRDLRGNHRFFYSPPQPPPPPSSPHLVNSRGLVMQHGIKTALSHPLSIVDILLCLLFLRMQGLVFVFIFAFVTGGRMLSMSVLQAEPE